MVIVRPHPIRMDSIFCMKFKILQEIQDFAKNSRFSTERMHVIYIRRLVLDILDAFSNEWYEKNPQHLSFLGAWFGSGAMRISG